MRFVAKTLGVTSGKGGVGKTFCSLNIAKSISELGKRVLLIDCDFNLGNCGFALGIKEYSTLVDFVNGKPADDCITKVSSFDFIGAESGDLQVLEGKHNLTESLLKLIFVLQRKYDFIILDCGAGLDEKLLSVLAYCDHRFVVTNPDTLSLKDSYALVKVLTRKYGVENFHFLPNKIQSKREKNRLEQVMKVMTEKFLGVQITFLNSINLFNRNPDSLCQDLGSEKFSVKQDFIKVIKNFLDDEVEDNIPLWKNSQKQDAFFERLRSN